MARSGDFRSTKADAAKLPTGLSGMHIYPIDGAVQRQKRDATAWGYRDVAWSMVIFGVDPDPANAPALKKWARDYWEAVHPFNLAGAYANFMMDDEGESRVKAAYGENYNRLATLKRKFDPANLFRPPAETSCTRARDNDRRRKHKPEDFDGRFTS